MSASRYCILEFSAPGELESAVNEYLSGGWQLVGGLSVETICDIGPMGLMHYVKSVYAQAMFLPASAQLS